jgi:hypothetical protein
MMARIWFENNVASFILSFKSYEATLYLPLLNYYQKMGHP